MAKKAIRIDISTKAIRYKANLEAMACEASFTWMKMVSAILESSQKLKLSFNGSQIKIL